MNKKQIAIVGVVGSIVMTVAYFLMRKGSESKSGINPDSMLSPEHAQIIIDLAVSVSPDSPIAEAISDLQAREILIGRALQTTYRQQYNDLYNLPELRSSFPTLESFLNYVKAKTLRISA